MVLFVCLLAVVCGCEAPAVRLKGYEGTLTDDKLAELCIPDDIRLISIDGKQFPGVTDDEPLERERAVAAANAYMATGMTPQRYIQIPAGSRTLVIGVAKQMVAVKRETPIAWALLSGHMTYQLKMYPGSTKNTLIKFDAAAKATYRIRIDFHRPQKNAPREWQFKLINRNSDLPVKFDATQSVRSTYKSSSDLAPEDWLDQQREEQKK